jgi:hypothetical protein
MLRMVLAALAFAGVSTAAAAEQLILEPYPGPPSWTEVTDEHQGGKFHLEFIPTGQEVESYRDILTAQSFPGLQLRTDPAAFIRTINQGTRKTCGDVRINGPTTRHENGYVVAYAQIYCNRQTGRSTGAAIFFKVMRGEDALYVVRREFRTPPTAVAGVQSFPKDKLAEMANILGAEGVGDQYLRGSVYLCGGHSTDARCAKR